MNPWKAKLFLDALDERIVPDATPVVTYADGFTSGAVVAAYDSGGSSGNDIITYADGHTSGAVVVSYDNGHTSASDIVTYDFSGGSGSGSGIVTYADGHTSGAVVAAYDNGGSGSGVVTYADGHTSGAVVATFDSGSGSGSDTTTVLIATTIIDRADLIKERDRLNALIQKNKDAITANLVKIADWNSCIKCATDYLNGLKAELSAIRTRQSATQVEWNTLVGRGYSSGPLLDALNLKLKAIDQEIVENGKATDSCNDEISRESSERGTLVQANLDLARDNAAQQIKLNAVNSLLDSQKKGA